VPQARPEERQVALLWGVVAISSIALRPFWLALAPFAPRCPFRVLTGFRARHAVRPTRYWLCFTVRSAAPSPPTRPPLRRAIAFVVGTGGTGLGGAALARAGSPDAAPAWARAAIVGCCSRTGFF